MGRRRVGIVLAALLAGCSGAAPTPQIIYVTAPPFVQPTPQVIFVTPSAESSLAPATPETDTIGGELALYVGDRAHAWASNANCSGPTNGSQLFPQIHTGTELVIHDGTGAVVGTGALGSGRATTVAGSAPGLHGWSQECDFMLSATARRSDFYTVTVTGLVSDPAVQPYTISYADLAAAGWKLNLSVGP